MFIALGSCLWVSASLECSFWVCDLLPSVWFLTARHVCCMPTCCLLHDSNTYLLHAYLPAVIAFRLRCNTTVCYISNLLSNRTSLAKTRFVDSSSILRLLCPFEGYIGNKPPPNICIAVWLFLMYSGVVPTNYHVSHNNRRATISAQWLRT